MGQQEHIRLPAGSAVRHMAFNGRKKRPRRRTPPRTKAILSIRNALAQPVHNPGRLQRRGAGFHGASIAVHWYRILSGKPSGKSH